MIYWRISAGAGGIMNELTDAKFISWALVRHKSRRRASIARPATIHTRRPYDPTQLVCRTLLDTFFTVRRAAARQAPGPYRFRSHVPRPNLICCCARRRWCHTGFGPDRIYLYNFQPWFGFIRGGRATHSVLQVRLWCSS